MTKELRRLSILMLAMFLALFISTSWIQVVNADALAQNPDNTRARYDSYEVQRGSIIVSGSAIASSVSTTDVYQWQRVYADAADVGPRDRLVQPGAGLDDGHRAGDEPGAERHRRIAVLLPDRAHHHGSAAARIERRADAGCRSPACRVRRPRRAPGRRHRHRPRHRSGARDGVEPRLRHEPAGGPRRDRGQRLLRPAGRRPGGPAVRSVDRGRSQPARIDVQARRRFGGARVGRLHAGVDAAEPGGLPAAAVERHRLERERRHVRTRASR